MKDNFKWLLVAGAVGYVLFKDQIGAWLDSRGALPASSSSSDANAAVDPTPPPISAALDTTTTKGRIAAAASHDAFFQQGQGAMSVDHWNFYYQQIRGIPGPTAAALGFPTGDMQVTLDEYWAAMTRSGLGRVSAAGRAWGYAR